MFYSDDPGCYQACIERVIRCAANNWMLASIDVDYENGELQYQCMIHESVANVQDYTVVKEHTAQTHHEMAQRTISLALLEHDPIATCTNVAYTESGMVVIVDNDLIKPGQNQADQGQGQCDALKAGGDDTACYKGCLVAAVECVYQGASRFTLVTVEQNTGYLRYACIPEFPGKVVCNSGTMAPTFGLSVHHSNAERVCEEYFGGHGSVCTQSCVERSRWCKFTSDDPMVQIHVDGTTGNMRHECRRADISHSPRTKCKPQSYNKGPTVYWSPTSPGRECYNTFANTHGGGGGPTDPMCAEECIKAVLTCRNRNKSLTNTYVSNADGLIRFTCSEASTTTHQFKPHRIDVVADAYTGISGPRIYEPTHIDSV
jgi:hypothetical protein